MKKSLKNEWTPALEEPQEDLLLQRALRQKFDEEHRRKWAAQLAQEGIVRTPQAKVVAWTRRRILTWAAAAVFVLAAGAVGWHFAQNSQPEYVALSAGYLDELAGQAAQVRMGAGDAGNAAWLAARENYTQRKFAEAVAGLQKLSASQPLTTEQAYLLALSHLQVTPPDADAAMQAIGMAHQAAAATPDAPYREEIEWLAALILLQKQEKRAAANSLQTIAKAGGWYAEKAQKLLEKTN